MGKPYVNNTGRRIRTTLCKDITDLTSMTYEVKKPDTTEESWECTVENYASGIVYHTVTGTDFNQSGRYFFNPLLIDSEGHRWKTNTQYFDVYEAYN